MTLFNNKKPRINFWAGLALGVVAAFAISVFLSCYLFHEKLKMAVISSAFGIIGFVVCFIIVDVRKAKKVTSQQIS
jgi:hypothetical protein